MKMSELLSFMVIGIVFLCIYVPKAILPVILIVTLVVIVQIKKERKEAKGG